MESSYSLFSLDRMIGSEEQEETNKWLGLQNRIESTRNSIKEEATKLYNEIFKQQVTLLNRVNKVEKELNSHIVEITSMNRHSNIRRDDLCEAYLENLNVKLNRELDEVKQIGFTSSIQTSSSPDVSNMKIQYKRDLFCLFYSILFER